MVKFRTARLTLPDARFNVFVHVAVHLAECDEDAHCVSLAYDVYSLIKFLAEREHDDEQTHGDNNRPEIVPEHITGNIVPAVRVRHLA